MDQIKILSDVMKILKTKDSHCFLSSNCELNVKTKDGEVLKCFIPAVTYIAKISTQDGFIGITKEEKASIYQWLEYCLLHSTAKDKEVLMDLNSFLKDKTYFVSNRYTVADLILYLCLHEVYSKMSFQEKESYCNLSRWFRLIQNDASASDLYPKVYFTKTQLYT